MPTLSCESQLERTGAWTALLLVAMQLGACSAPEIGAVEAATAALESAPDYESVVLQDDPAGYWRLGEQPGAPQARDIGPSGRNGTYRGRNAPTLPPQLGMPGAIAGDSDTAARFYWYNDYQQNPVTQWNYVEIPHHPSLVPPSPALSLEAWFTMPAFSTYSAIIATGTANGVNGYGLIYWNNQIWFFIGHLNHKVGFPVSLLKPNAFNHIVATWDGQRAKIYLDGTRVANQVAGSWNPGTGPLLIGKAWLGSWQGVIDEAAIYHHALSEERVLAHYRAGARVPDADCTRATLEGHDYWFCRTQRAFDVARANCEAVGMQLASIDSAGENTFAAGRAQDGSYIGLTNEPQDEVWRWLSDERPGWCGAASGYAPLHGYAGWGTGQPLAGSGVASCARMRAGTGRWESADCAAPRGYVCETLEPEPEVGWFAAESEGPLYHRNNYSLATARLTGGFDADATVRRYREELRLRDCVDELEPASTPRPTENPDEEVTYYQHTYKGIPVLGSGYMLLRERANGTVTELSGRIEPSIEADVNPQITKEQAVVAAAQAVSHPRSSYPANVDAELAIAPVPDAAGVQTYRLVWQVSLPPVADDGAYLASVNASSGHVVRFASGRVEQCTSIDTAQPPGTPSPAVGHIWTLSTHNGDPDNMTLTKYEAAGGNQYGLLTSGLLAPNGLPFVGRLATHPQVRTICEGHDPNASAVAVPDHTFAEGQNWQPHDAFPAAAYTAMVQQALEYWNVHHQMPDSASNVPWTGFDGWGDVPVLITLDRTSKWAQAGAYYHPDPPRRLGLNPDKGTSLQLEIAGHELAHAVLDTLVSRSATTSVHTSLPEALAVNEGFADAFGTAVEWYVRSADRRDFCFIPNTPFDPANPQAPRACVMNLAAPALSTGRACSESFAAGTDNRVPEPSGTCPAMYIGPGFCLDTDTRTCDVHHNGTIIGHWLYNLVYPEPYALRDDGCRVSIPDIDPTPGASDPDVEKRRFERAAKILFTGARDFYIPNGNFAAFASATVAAARKLGGDELAAAAAASWFSVNLWDVDYEKITSEPTGMADTYSPKNGARDVPAWPTFMWRADPSVEAWNLQVDTRPSFDGPELVQQLDINGAESTHLGDHDFIVANGIALPANSAKRYYWRAVPVKRQQPTSPIGCAAVHFFESTGNVPKIAGVVNMQDGFVEAAPGFSTFTWLHVRGATKYFVQVEDHETSCRDDAGETYVATAPSDLDTEISSISIQGLQPGRQDYHLMIRPIGPRDASGNETQGACETFRVRTLPLQAPKLLNPEDRVYNYYSPHSYGSGNLQWQWIGFGGAHHYDLQFYDRDAGGNCPPTQPVTDPVNRPKPARFYRIDEPCLFSNCFVTVDDDLLPRPNPSGYCWDVVAYSSNDTSSMSANRGMFRYALPSVVATRHEVEGVESIGVDSGNFELRSYPPELRTLGDDSYGKRLTLRWQPMPADVSRYMVKHGKWPWRTPISPNEPLNCSTCDEGPAEAAEPQLVEGTELEVPANVGGEGRYCWMVWPLLDGAIQPLLFDVRKTCYTTGPADPIFAFETGDPLPPSAGFNDDAIKFSITFPYLPDGKWDAKVDGLVADSQIERSPECEVDVETDPYAWTPDKAWIYGDLYNCKLTVTFTPIEGQTYKISGITFGADDEPIEHTLKEFTMGRCGGLDETCCDSPAGSKVCDDDALILTCNDENKCVECGGAGQPCCAYIPGCGLKDSSECDEPTQTCVSCGDAPGARCCSGNYCFSPFGDITCNPDSSLCELCGGSGQQCCEGGVCRVDNCFDGFCQCVPETCGTRCGDVSNGCGGTLDCGNCGLGKNCINHQCQGPDICDPGETVPGAPQNLSPGSDGNLSQFVMVPLGHTLTWDAVPGATQYEVVHIRHDARSSSTECDVLEALINDPALQFNEHSFLLDHECRVMWPLRFPQNSLNPHLNLFSDRPHTCRSSSTGDSTCAAFYEWAVRAINACGAGPWSGALYGHLQ